MLRYREPAMTPNVRHERWLDARESTIDCQNFVSRSTRVFLGFVIVNAFRDSVGRCGLGSDAHGDPITQGQPLSAAVLPFPVKGHLVATVLHRHGGARLRFCETPDVTIDTCAVVGVVAGVVEHAREITALGLVVAHDLCTLELVLSHLRIPAVQHEEAARQPFVAFVARPRNTRRTRVGGILPVTVGRSFGMPGADEDFEALVGR